MPERCAWAAWDWTSCARPSPSTWHRRDRSGSAPRSVVLRHEIGPVPRRDRSQPASRSVVLRTEIGSAPEVLDIDGAAGGLEVGAHGPAEVGVVQPVQSDGCQPVGAVDRGPVP